METLYKKCIVCNNDFTATRSEAKTCSQQCRNVLSISRKIAQNFNVRTGAITPLASVMTDDIEDKNADTKDIITKQKAVITYPKEDNYSIMDIITGRRKHKSE